MLSHTLEASIIGWLEAQSAQRDCITDLQDRVRTLEEVGEAEVTREAPSQDPTIPTCPRCGVEHEYGPMSKDWWFLMIEGEHNEYIVRLAWVIIEEAQKSIVERRDKRCLTCGPMPVRDRKHNLSWP